VDYKSLLSLLPNNLEAFYTYSGSLTTPPCYQVVNWIVMAERMTMNSKQIEMFRNLYAPPKHDHETASTPDDNQHQHQDTHNEAQPTVAGTELIMPNIRALQRLNNRTILASFTKHGSRLDTVTSPYSSAAHGRDVSTQRELLYLPLALASVAMVFQLYHSQRRALE
jgi:hypothetical protein